MKHMLLLLLFCCLFSCAQKIEGPRQKADNLNALFEQYWDERAQYNTLEATQQGDNRYNHIIANDQTATFRKTQRTFYANYLERLEDFDRETLGENDKISYDVFKFEMVSQLEGLKFKGWKIPFQQFWGLPLSMGQLGSGESFQPFKTIQDYENWIGRMRDFSIWTDSAIENFRKGMKSEFVLPKILVEKMIPQMEKLIVREPRKSLFYHPILNMPNSFTRQEKKNLAVKYIEAINRYINPSYKELKNFLEKEYLPHARETHGISGLPDGAEMYKYLVKSWTTTNLTPAEIYQMGLNEVSRIRLEMERVKDEVKFKGNLSAFFDYMKTDKKFTPYQHSTEILNAFHDIHRRMSPQLKVMFNRTPKTPFEIRKTEDFRAASASAEYNQGSPDGTRPGIFYIPILNPKKFNTTSGMESLFLHEAIPGHHYQISLQQENGELPKFRRFAWYGAYGEGWALYTESLGRELGLYKDPYQYMGALGDEMHRAVRLVVDVGIHTMGMKKDEAVKYMMNHQAISEEGAVAEIERYMAIPGQALSYKIGSLKIWELRKKYAKKLGKKFNLQAFHDELLKDGCLPLEVLERKMDAWVKTF